MATYDNTNSRPVSRRRFFAIAGAGAACWLGSRDALGGLRLAHAALVGDSLVEKVRRAAATDPMKVDKLRGNISVVYGSGGNVAVFPGSDGTLLVDAGIVGPRVAESVAKITDTPVRYLINTHWHFDHTDANAFWNTHGAAITAHENTRKHLNEQTRVVDWNYTFPPAPPAALPTTVLSDERAIRLNGSRIAARYYGPAHTDSDISVHFADSDVLHVGDTFWNGLYPFIDYSTGGSIDGMIRSTNDNLARVSSTTVIIPGHGPVGNKAQLTTYRDMLVAVRDRVATLKQQGRSVMDVVAEKPTAEFDKKWGAGLIEPTLFTRLVYKGI